MTYRAGPQVQYENMLFHTDWERCMSWECKGGSNGWCHPEYLTSFHTCTPKLACFLKTTFPAALILGVQTTGVLAVSSRQPPPSPTESVDEEGGPCLCLRPWDRLCCMCWTTGYIWNPLLSSTPPDQAVWWSQTCILASLMNSAMAEWQQASHFSLALAIAPEWARL